MPGKALQLVSIEEAPPGDLELTREAMASWKEGQRRCRARRRHNWGPFTVYVHGSWYEVVEQCSHCRNRRAAEYVKTPRGLRKATNWKADYREGYLLPKGATPLRWDEGLMDELTESDILTRKLVEVDDGDAD